MLINHFSIRSGSLLNAELSFPPPRSSSSRRSSHSLFFFSFHHLKQETWTKSEPAGRTAEDNGKQPLACRCVPPGQRGAGRRRSPAASSCRQPCGRGRQDGPDRAGPRRAGTKVSMATAGRAPQHPHSRDAAAPPTVRRRTRSCAAIATGPASRRPLQRRGREPACEQRAERQVERSRVGRRTEPTADAAGSAANCWLPGLNSAFTPQRLSGYSQLRAEVDMLLPNPSTGYLHTESITTHGF